MPGTAGPLLEQIRGSATVAAAGLVTAARTEADSIRAQAGQHADRQRREALSVHGRSAAAALARTRADTAARVGRDTLAARATALDRIFAEAVQRLDALSVDPKLRDLLAGTVNDGLTYLPDGPACVGCASAIADVVRAVVAATGRADVAVRIDDGIPIGVLIEAGDRSVVVDGTLVRRVSHERPRLSAEVARRIVERPA